MVLGERVLRKVGDTRLGVCEVRRVGAGGVGWGMGACGGVVVMVMVIDRMMHGGWEGRWDGEWKDGEEVDR